MNHEITTDPDQDENSKPSDGTHRLESIDFLPCEFLFSCSPLALLISHEQNFVNSYFLLHEFLLDGCFYYTLHLFIYLFIAYINLNSLVLSFSLTKLPAAFIVLYNKVFSNFYILLLQLYLFYFSGDTISHHSKIISCFNMSCKTK